MAYIELLKATRKHYKVKFISLLKGKCNLTSKELSEIYDDLLQDRNAYIYLNLTDTNSLNCLSINLMDLEISLGNSSFHEESGDNGIR